VRVVIKTIIFGLLLSSVIFVVVSHLSCGNKPDLKEKLNFYKIESASLLSLKDLFISVHDNNLAFIDVLAGQHSDSSVLLEVLLKGLEESNKEVIGKLDEALLLQARYGASLYYYIDKSEHNPHTGVILVHNDEVLKRIILLLH